MGNISIRYTHVTEGCHISGTNDFSLSEVTAFLEHFQKRHKCTIPYSREMLKLVSGVPLEQSEEDAIIKTIGSDIFRKFIDYVNKFMKKKYAHSLRPGCLSIAQKLRKIADQITIDPSNSCSIEKRISQAMDIEMPRNDAPFPIQKADIIGAVSKKNTLNHEQREYEAFAEIKIWRTTGKFEVRYNQNTQRIFFGSHAEKWFVCVDSKSYPQSLKENTGTQEKWGTNSYELLLENGDKYIFSTKPYGEGGTTIVFDFIPNMEPATTLVS